MRRYGEAVQDEVRLSTAGEVDCQTGSLCNMLTQRAISDKDVDCLNCLFIF